MHGRLQQSKKKIIKRLFFSRDQISITACSLSYFIDPPITNYSASGHYPTQLSYITSHIGWLKQNFFACSFFVVSDRLLYLLDLITEKNKTLFSFDIHMGSSSRGTLALPSWGFFLQTKPNGKGWFFLALTRAHDNIRFLTAMLQFARHGQLENCQP